MKRIVLGIGILVVALFTGLVLWWYNTKSFSPENSLEFEDANLHISVSYNRPFKKGRVIFGGLVPYGKTWRTGANEATTFETNQDLFVGGKKLVKGIYSLWTVPGENSWEVVFNKTIPPWGIDVMKNGEASRDPNGDVLITVVPVVISPKEIEQFTITIEKGGDSMELVLLWDRSVVAVPIYLNEQ